MSSLFDKNNKILSQLSSKDNDILINKVLKNILPDQTNSKLTNELPIARNEDILKDLSLVASETKDTSLDDSLRQIFKLLLSTSLARATESSNTEAKV